MTWLLLIYRPSHCTAGSLAPPRIGRIAYVLISNDIRGHRTTLCRLILEATLHFGSEGNPRCVLLIIAV